MKYRIALLLFCLLGCFLPEGKVRAGEPPREYQIKAAFMVNMAKFITWPENNFPKGEEPFVIGIAGDDPFGQTLEIIKKKTIRNHPIEVVHIQSPDALPRCHMLFIARSEVYKLEQYFQLTTNSPSPVTLSDIEGFLMAGGMIEFSTRDDHLAFMINNTLMKSHALYSDASLLRLAIEVQ